MHDRADDEVKIRNCIASILLDNSVLYAEELRLAVFWTPKAGCTFALKWFLFQAGLLEAARRYNSEWPHAYRIDVLSRKPGYVGQAPYVLLPGWKRIKFVRNPYDRAVSAYLTYSDVTIHQQREGHGDVLDALSGHLGRTISEHEGFTFREFVSCLEAIDLDSCNMHIRRQVGPCEREGVLRDLSLIRIEEAFRELPLLEDRLGLPHADLDQARKSGHHTIREESDEFVGDRRFLRTVADPAPPGRCFYDADLQVRVGELYREDFLRYGYPLDTIGAITGG